LEQSVKANEHGSVRQPVSFPDYWLPVAGVWCLVSGFGLLPVGGHYHLILDAGYSILDESLNRLTFIIEHQILNIEH